MQFFSAGQCIVIKFNIFDNRTLDTGKRVVKARIDSALSDTVNGAPIYVKEEDPLPFQNC